MIQLLMVIFGIVGVLNGLFLSVYIYYVQSKKNPPDKYLALLLLFLSLRMGKSILSSITPVSFLSINIGLAAFACVGPSLFLYFKKSYKQKPRISYTNTFHFLPAVLVLLCTFSTYSPEDPIWNTRYDIIMLQIFIYLVLSFILIFKNILPPKNNFYEKNWYLFLIVSTFIIWFAYGFTWWFGWLPYLSGTLLFCFVVYIMVFLWLKKRQSDKHTERYKNSVLSTEESKILFGKLNLLMISSRPHLNNEITLSKLASLMEIKPHVLSQIINENTELNFFEFINFQRIEEVKKRFAEKEYNNHTIAAVAFTCGFNSISSFNTAFKKFVKRSPNEYRSGLLE